MPLFLREQFPTNLTIYVFYLKKAVLCILETHSQPACMNFSKGLSVYLFLFFLSLCHLTVFCHVCSKIYYVYPRCLFVDAVTWLYILIALQTISVCNAFLLQSNLSFLRDWNQFGEVYIINIKQDEGAHGYNAK